jgi:Cu+-exporting ATPase
MKTKDPVCGMEIDMEAAFDKIEYESDTYYFCSEHCKEKFEGEPAKYIHKEE